jgi:hypothetical protein
MLKWKVSMDGTDCAAKQLVAFFLVPLSLGRNEQSNKNVMPIGLAWCQESADVLDNLLPNLAGQIAEVERDGITLPGQPTLQVRIEIAADMASLWKGTRIGSDSNKHSCIYCNVSKQGREVVGSFASSRGEWRGVDDLNVVGVKMDRVHICALHGLTRITEKLLDMLACALSAEGELKMSCKTKSQSGALQCAVSCVLYLRSGCFIALTRTTLLPIWFSYL